MDIKNQILADYINSINSLNLIQNKSVSKWAQYVNKVFISLIYKTLPILIEHLNNLYSV